MSRFVFVCLGSLALALSIAAPASAQGAKGWKCAAPGLVNASYDGGATAYVQLVGYTSGGNYPVDKNKAGTVATGTTGNGTKFTCTRG